MTTLLNTLIAKAKATPNCRITQANEAGFACTIEFGDFDEYDAFTMQGWPASDKRHYEGDEHLQVIDIAYILN